MSLSDDCSPFSEHEKKGKTPTTDVLSPRLSQFPLSGQVWPDRYVRMSRPCSSTPKKRGVKGKPFSSSQRRRSWTNAALPTARPAHGASHAHDPKGESSTRQGNLCQRFSRWLCFHYSRAYAPCSVLPSPSGRLSSKIRIVRKGSQSQNPFVPQGVAWRGRGDRIAPVGK